MGAEVDKVEELRVGDDRGHHAEGLEVDVELLAAGLEVLGVGVGEDPLGRECGQPLVRALQLVMKLLVLGEAVFDPPLLAAVRHAQLVHNHVR